ncbi:MAG TPA: ATP-dependent DNA ligase [Candidatus Nanoarchaeia archaeon]|nr:ATP-dependent DNA ligase [Candidatus Nanoarchaeia archaeon]
MHYGDLVAVYAKLQQTTKRLAKTKIVAEVISSTAAHELPKVILLLQGRVFPSYDERKIGVASKLVMKAIALAAGIAQPKVEQEWSKLGDLGSVAAQVIKGKKQHTLSARDLTVEKVFANIQKLATLSGSGSVDQKVRLVAELLTAATPEEAKYIVRTVLEDLRVGVGEGALRDGIVWAVFGDELQLQYDEKKGDIHPTDRKAYNEKVALVQRAYDLCNDFAEVAAVAKEQGEEGLAKVTMAIGKPMKVMLFQKVNSIMEAFAAVGRPAAFEYKYDGFRIVIHRDGDKVTLYTRRLEDITKQFPEVVQYVKKQINGSRFVLDAEAVGFNKSTGKYLPFQSISQRIRRKYDIDKLAALMPVEVNVFDVLSYGGESYLGRSFVERRKLLEQIVTPHAKKLVLARQLVTDSEREAEEFYQEALRAGEEGVMAKNLEGIYKPGSRVGYGVKVKPVMETLDLAIVAAEWGEGKRAGWLTSYLLACRDPDTGELLEVGRVSTGVKELEESGVNYAQITEILKEQIISAQGKMVRVKPMLVIEVNYEEIQQSPTYSSGFALRFPRFVRLREDKDVSDISTIDQVERLYATQER